MTRFSASTKDQRLFAPDSIDGGSVAARSASLPVRAERRVGRAWLLATIAAAILYGLTLAPGVTWGDSADAQVRVLLGHWCDRQYLVRSHVPYYVTATGLAKAGLAPALAANVLSAAAGAVTVGNVAWMIALLVRRRVAVFCGVCLLMLSHVLWHVSTVAEVMTLSTMLLSFELVFLLYFIQQRRFRWLVAAFLANGVGLATHSMASLTWPAYLPVLVLLRDAIPPPRGIRLCVGLLALLVGASPLIGVFAAGMRANPDVSAVIQDMLVARYGSFVFNTSFPLPMLARVIGYIGYSFPSPLVFLVPIGLVVLWRGGSRPTAWLLTIAFVAHFVFAFRYNVPDQHMFLLHTLVMGAVLVAVGVERAAVAFPSIGVAAVLGLASVTAPVVYATVPDVLRRRMPDFAALPSRRLPHRDEFSWFLKPWRHGYTGPERFARETLEAVPSDAVLVVDSTPMPTLVYVQVAEGLRRDVRIIGAERFQDWLGPFDLASGDRDEAIRAGRMFTIAGDRQRVHDVLRSPMYGFVRRGAVFQVVFAEDARVP